MRNLKFPTLLVFLSVILSVAFLVNVTAFEVHNSENDLEVIERYIDDDVYVFGERYIEVSSDISGDLFIFAGESLVSGNIEGDVYVFGGGVAFRNTDIKNIIGGDVTVVAGDASIESDVLGGIKVLSGNIEIDSDVSKDVMVAGGSVKIEGEVDGDVRIASGAVDIDGVKIAEDLLIGGGDTDISGEVGGDLIVGSGNLDLSDLEITGDLLIYTDEGERPEVGEDVEVGGLTEYREGETEVKVGDTDLRPFTAKFLGLGLFFRFLVSVVSALGAILLGAVIYKLAPVKVETIKKKLGKEELLKSGLIGLLMFPFGGLLLLILMFSFVGWQLAFFLFSLYLVVYICAVPLFAFKLGKWVLVMLGEKHEHPILDLVAGVCAINLLRLIPYVGWFIYIGILCVMIGTLVRMKYQMLVHRK